ncbi:MAG: DUF7405 family protein [Dehalococcoidia bacterium]
MPLSRRALLQRGAQAAAVGSLSGRDMYRLLDGLAARPLRKQAADQSGLPLEQHLLLDERVLLDDGVEVVVGPLHHQIVTANLCVAATVPALLDARQRLELALAALERAYRPAASGVAITIAWGLPYFSRFVPDLAARYLPLDPAASLTTGAPVGAVTDAIPYPSDPDDLLLERNEMAVLLRSDAPEFIAAAHEAIFGGLDDLFEVTSIRRGFVGGGFAGGQSLPKLMATAAGIPGAESIPDRAELFLGFTSWTQAAIGTGRIANFETLPGFTDQWPDGYFRHGTAMHLSHLYEDLEAWYDRFNFSERAAATFRPGLEIPEGRLTIANDRATLPTQADVIADAQRFGAAGHNASIQPVSRLPEDTLDNYGVQLFKGNAIPQRADFNTLDNPFFWSAVPDTDRQQDLPAAGLHFVAFTPSTDFFNRTRLAMDGRYRDGSLLPFAPGSRSMGINAVLRTTHRQNFVVPPRAHRSFPLVELL